MEGLCKSFKVHKFITQIFKGHSQLAFSCLKSTIETLEKCLKYVQS